MGRSTLAVSIASLLFFCASTSAAAGGSSDASLAEALFQEGKRLMIAHKFSEACPKLAESQRLDPAGGTLLSLALCHESEGKLASAWTEFKDAEAIAKRDARKDRVKICGEHIKAIEPKLQMVTIVVADKSDGLEVKRDDKTIGSAAFGTPFPVDPGEHRFTATAPSKKSWSKSLTIRSEKSTTVEIPKLEDEQATAAAAPPPSSTASSTESKPAENASQSAPDAATPTPSSSSTPWPAYVLLGVGAVGLGVGGYFAFDASSKQSDADALCPDVRCNSPSAVQSTEDALTSANVANIAIGVGAVAAIVGVVLLITSSSSEAPKKAAVLRW